MSMGLGWHTLKLLCEARSRGLNIANTVTIGRQRLGVPVSDVLHMLEEHGFAPPLNADLSLGSLVYADAALSWLGAQRVESIDYSDYENATMLWDMNVPIPEKWHEQFDFVLDCGSIEHIFNISQVVANYMNLARVGGTIMVATMANNAVGHGFYQFSPEFFYRVFSASNGFEVNRLALHEMYTGSPIYEVPDPANIHSRLELSNSWLSVYIVVQVRRIRKTELFQSWPQQSDYTELWDGEANEAHVQPVLHQLIRQPHKQNNVRKWFDEKFPHVRNWKRALEQKILDRYPMLAQRKLAKGSRQWHVALRKQFALNARPEWFRPTQ
jgi:hypothetical protein